MRSLILAVTALSLCSAPVLASSPMPTSALKTARLVSSAATTNATSVKATNGTMTRIVGYNAASTARYLKLYDKSSAPTVGTDTPRKTIYLPASSAFALDMDDYFGQGIAYAITANAADSDTTAGSSGDIVSLNIDYR
jgi:hypothetical protein